MKTKHTPGPWEVIQIYYADGKTPSHKHVAPPGDWNRKYIASIHRENGDANAKLIAAAPELLEVCQLVMQSDIDGSFVSAAKWWKKMESAIKKATL